MSSTQYGIHPDCDGGNNSSGSSGGLLNTFKATKKFFKKIYDTATLPGRANSKILVSNATEQDEIPTTSLSLQQSFIDASYSLELPDDEQSYQDNHDNANQNVISSYNIASHDSNPASTKIKPVMLMDDITNDSGLSRSISSNDSQKTSCGDFRSWNEVFNHLRREMAYMRQRDAQIFADLQFVEQELRNVKNQALVKSDYVKNNSNSSININENIDNNHILDKREIKLGDLVESMPL
ncbi:hypothetical protein X798_05128 [Onchocerca flexuosa]|uniref:Uncharacterized protein n=2 Tax=Onchocerca flexuosa TaxID=387005 RepID=A0A238BTA5_9BILA|nr:hypothetical protein X798_05128 [Onchocerca flexuosa]